jgi:hypothetical protein
MEKRTFHAGVVLLLMTVFISVAVRAVEVSINDISANPAGAALGPHPFQDDGRSGPASLRCQDLPALGRAEIMILAVLQVLGPGSSPETKGQERDDAGRFSESTRNLLIGLGAVLLILIIVFIVLLLLPNKNVPARSKPDTAIKPGTQPEAPKGEGAMPTVAISQPAPQGDVTQLLENPFAKLVVEQGPDQDLVFTISKNTSTIGRSGNRINDVVLTDNTVSKVQATLYFDPASGRFSIMNEGLKNPTKVNGAIVDQQALLGGGELIEMGKTALRFKKL